MEQSKEMATGCSTAYLCELPSELLPQSSGTATRNQPPRCLIATHTLYRPARSACPSPILVDGIGSTPILIHSQEITRKNAPEGNEVPPGAVLFTLDLSKGPLGKLPRKQHAGADISHIGDNSTDRAKPKPFRILPQPLV